MLLPETSSHWFSFTGGTWRSCRRLYVKVRTGSSEDECRKYLIFSNTSNDKGFFIYRNYKSIKIKYSLNQFKTFPSKPQNLKDIAKIFPPHPKKQKKIDVIKIVLTLPLCTISFSFFYVLGPSMSASSLEWEPVLTAIAAISTQIHPDILFSSALEQPIFVRGKGRQKKREKDV